MPKEKVSDLPMPAPGEIPAVFYAPGRTASMPAADPREKKDDPSRLLLEESAVEALQQQIRKPLRLDTVDLRKIVTRSVTMLSLMSSELGVAFRLRIRGQNVTVTADMENVRRSINGLIVYLLTLSQSQGCITVGVEDRMENGKRGMSIDLTASDVTAPWKTDAESGAELGDPPEISTCRRLLERNGGSLTVQSEPEQGLALRVWIPVKGTGGK
jgi:hypothetical protein